jgi:hypothetical protein
MKTIVRENLAADCNKISARSQSFAAMEPGTNPDRSGSFWGRTHDPPNWRILHGQ